MDRRHFVLTAAAAAIAPGLAGRARAQAYPSQMVTLVVPFSGGSMTDILARTIGQKLSERWGQTVIVENRPGIPGAQSVARGAKDGHTLMLTSNGHVVMKAVNKSLAFDPVTDFAPISRVALTPSILIVPANSPAQTLGELIALIKAKPGELSYASAGVSSSTGIAAELFRTLIDGKIVMVPHRGLPEANLSVLRGDVGLGFTFFSVGGDLVQSKQMRALAVTGDKRMAQFPDVPTFKEAGLPQFEYDAWFGVMAALDTPKPIVDKVSQDLASVLEDKGMIELFGKQGVALSALAAEPFGAIMRTEADKFGKLIEAVGK